MDPNQQYHYPGHQQPSPGDHMMPPNAVAMQAHAFQMQPFGQPPPIIPFSPHIMGPPPIPGVSGLPDLSFPGGFANLTEQSVSASALERLQLPQDKITETGIIPNNPYYKLPAGIMVPLVPIHRNEYQPIDPKDLRLPFPKFPDENFLRMIDSYYSNDKDKRDSDGWESRFLDTYLKQKEALSKMHAEINR